MATDRDRAVLNQILNPLTPTTTSDEENIELEEVFVDHEGFPKSLEFEREGVRLAEGGKLDDSIAIFTKAIEACPVNPSAYNNRAQAYRLKQQVNEAISDLDVALRVSSGKGKAACQAYVQRASIFRLQGDNDKAREDFQCAAQMGSSFAKMQLVALNPYAAMCNQMLSEVFQNLKNGDSS